MSADHRSNNFDLIRLAAAAQVVLAHAIGHTGLLNMLSGWQRQLFDLLEWLPGVPVFFVISGFLITKSFERSGGNWAGYFWNRSLRIFPALWACLALTLVALFWYGFLPTGFVQSSTFWAWVAGQVSFLQFFNPEQFRGFGIGVANGALWTITVELQFYVFIPLLYATVFGRWKGTNTGSVILPALFAASYIAYCMMNVKVNGPGGFRNAPFAFKLLQNTLLPHLWMFMVGIFIHRHFADLRKWLEGKFLVYLALYLSLAAIMQLWIPNFSVKFYLCLLPARILLGAATVSAAYSAKSLSNRLLRGTDISYGIYIYHCVIINVFTEEGWLKSFTAVPLIFGAAVTVALLSWHLIEKPALACKSDSPRNWLAARFARGRAEPAVPLNDP